VKHRTTSRARKRKRKARAPPQEADDGGVGKSSPGQSSDRRAGGDGAEFPHIPTDKVAKPATVAKSAPFATSETVRPSPAMVSDVIELHRRMADSVRLARKQDGLTQEALGRRAEPPFRRNEINAYENGRRTITHKVLVRLAKALDRDPSWFVAPHDDA